MMHSITQPVCPFASATDEYGFPERERPTSQGGAGAATMAVPPSWMRNRQPVGAWDTIPERGCSAADASQRIAAQLAGDWDPSANLGTFATISMEPEADHLLMQTINKNLIDQYAYPGLEEIHQQVIAMLSALFHAPQNLVATGMATVGSSEAIMSGHTTFFAANEADWNLSADAIRREAAVKVMKRIRCRSFTQEACLTRWGTVVGPLQSELIGLPELTADRGGWCGNQLAIGSVSRDLEAQAGSSTRKLGEQLRRLGYRGCFDVDYLMDQDSGALYLGELNPRISGATPLTTLSCAAAGQLPLVLFHLLEYTDADLDLTPLIEAQSQQAIDAPWSSLIVKYRSERHAQVSTGPRGGIWKRDERGGVSFDRVSSRCLALRGAGEALVQRVARPGLRVCPGDDLVRIILRDQVLDASGDLNARARAWAQGVEAQISLEEATWQ